MTLVHIYRPQSWLGRAVRHCKTCRRRRRFLVIHYEWYASRWICGGCGYEWEDGQRSGGKKQRARNRERVKKEWPIAVRSREAIRKMCESFHR